MCFTAKPAAGRVRPIMSFLSAIGLHTWRFATGHPTAGTEVVRSWCSRDGCSRYQTPIVVHRETHERMIEPPSAQATSVSRSA